MVIGAGAIPPPFIVVVVVVCCYYCIIIFFVTYNFKINNQIIKFENK
jgi:hypothetical protein